MPVIAAPVEVKVATGVVNVVPPTAVDGVISKVDDATIDAATLQLVCVPAEKLGRNNIPTPLLPRTDKVSCWSLPLERLIIPVVNAPVDGVVATIAVEFRPVEVKVATCVLLA